MKLDRNINPDGRGKYALINLRRNTVEWGGEGNQFFVLKYKDRFTACALHAYADAVEKYASDIHRPADEFKSLMEYANDIRMEASDADKLGSRIPD